jgi:hypothetical protein
MRANGFVKFVAEDQRAVRELRGYLDPATSFGRAAANLGDLDQDGVVDVAVSANTTTTGGTKQGRDLTSCS